MPEYSAEEKLLEAVASDPVIDYSRAGMHVAGYRQYPAAWACKGILKAALMVDGAIAQVEETLGLNKDTDEVSARDAETPIEETKGIEEMETKTASAQLDSDLHHIWRLLVVASAAGRNQDNLIGDCLSLKMVWQCLRRLTARAATKFMPMITSLTFLPQQYDRFDGKATIAEVFGKIANDHKLDNRYRQHGCILSAIVAMYNSDKANAGRAIGELLNVWSNES